MHRNNKRKNLGINAVHGLVSPSIAVSIAVVHHNPMFEHCR